MNAKNTISSTVVLKSITMHACSHKIGVKCSTKKMLITLPCENVEYVQLSNINYIFLLDGNTHNFFFETCTLFNFPSYFISWQLSLHVFPLLSMVVRYFRFVVAGDSFSHFKETQTSAKEN